MASSTAGSTAEDSAFGGISDIPGEDQEDPGFSTYSGAAEDLPLTSSAHSQQQSEEQQQEPDNNGQDPPHDDHMGGIDLPNIEAQQQFQMVSNEYVTLGMLFRTPTFLTLFVSIPVVLAFSVGLIMDFSSVCEIVNENTNSTSPEVSESGSVAQLEKFSSFKSWTISFLIINFVMFFANASTISRFIRNPQLLNQTCSSVLSLTGVITGIAWFIDFIVGAVMVIKLSSDKCSDDIPFLYTIAHWVMVLGFIVIGLFICLIAFLCCICLICTGLGRRHLNSLGPQGTDESIIRSLKTVVYNDDLELPGTDRSCSICQGNYITGEEITFLPCHHHFHKECITPWLKDNKICPLCKEDVTRPGSGNSGDGI